MAGPQWLKKRMQEVGVKNLTGVERGWIFGSDKNWPVEKIDGKFLRFTPFSKFRIQHYEYDVEANIDQWGGRVTVCPSKKNTREIIPFLGDSFTFGVGVKDDETYVHLVNKVSSYSLINLGVSGSCLADHLDIIEYRHDELNSPRVYVFNVFVGNDLTNLLVYNTKKQEKGDITKLMSLRDKKSTKLLQFINDFVRNNELFRRIYLIQFLKSKLLILYNHYRVSSGVVPRMDDEIFHVIRKDQHFQDMIDLFDIQLERTKALSESLHFQPIFILIPDRHQVDEKLRKAKYEYYGIKERDVDIDLGSESLRAKLDDAKIPYVDVLDCFREKLNGKGDKNFYYTLDNHLTSEGHQAVYECMASRMDGMIKVSLQDELGNGR